MRSLIAVAVVCLTAGSAAQGPAAGVVKGAQDYSKEAYVIEQMHATYRYEKDGTGRRETHVRVKPQSEAGIQSWGQLALGYNSANERMEISFVRVHKSDGTIVTAPLDAVQDLSSPVQRIAPVYTDFRQKHVTVPALRPGETLEFKVVTVVHTPVAAGHFWIEHDFAATDVVFDERLEIDLPADVDVTLKTRTTVAQETVTTAGRRIHRWKTANLPMVDDEKKKSEEAKAADDGDEVLEPAAIRLTTFRSWDEVGRWYGGLETPQRRPSDEIRRKAQELTAGKAAAIDKIQALYDFVAKDFRYVSLSLGVGRYQPRAAADVLRDQYGDCKDKHTLLVSLLDTVGIRASSALVNSARKIDPDFPSPSQFDHVITRVTLPGEQVWLDTTTEVAPFRLLSANIRSKSALIVESAGSHLTETPADPPSVTGQNVEIDGRVNDSGRLNGTVRMTVRGDLDLMMRIIFRRTPAAQWKAVFERIHETSGLGGELGEWKVSDPADTRTPLRLEFAVTDASFVEGSAKSAQRALPLGDMALPSVPDGDKGTDKPIKLGSPQENEYRIRLELPASYTVRAPLGVAVQRDFGDYRSSYVFKDRLFSAERALKLKAPEISALRASEFAAFSRVVAADARQQVTLEGIVAAAAASDSKASAADLYRDGRQALDKRDYDRAIALLERAVKLEPKHRYAWSSLGRAHLGLRQYDAAGEALRKQIDINPYDEYAYSALGYVHLKKREFAEAETQLRKQLEINPLDDWAHATLGRVYVEWDKSDAAVPAFEKALSVKPNDASVHVDLGRAYLMLGRPADAITAFDRAVSLEPSPTMWNNVAYQLSLKKVELDRALRYAESAVSATTAASRNMTVKDVTGRELAVTSSLANYWDTLGWVYVAKGDLARAEPLVLAAWQLAQHSEVGDHLAQIYEKQGRREEALRAYAFALSSDGPTDEIRERFTKLAGGKAAADLVSGKHKDGLAGMRTLALTVKSAAEGSADFFILVGAKGVEDVRFIKGDEPLKPLAEELRRMVFAGAVPLDSEARIVRRATVTCGGSPAAKNRGCTAVLDPTDTARLD